MARPKTVRTKEFTDAVCATYAKGWSITRIARAMAVSEKTISRILKERGTAIVNISIPTRCPNMCPRVCLCEDL
jgi:DNA-binding transcriptional regulator LsrR (DeoR family)